MKTLSLLSIALLVAFGTRLLAAEPQKKREDGATKQEQLEQQFQQLLSGATLIGHYTLSEDGAPGPKEERYTISKLSKIKDDLWLFHARIQYGDHDLTLPLPLLVKWAGDTPMITLNNVPVPGLGTFSARVLIHNNQYAGTWGGKDHGGHLFGRIEPAVAAEEDTDAPSNKEESRE